MHYSRFLSRVIYISSLVALPTEDHLYPRTFFLFDLLLHFNLNKILYAREIQFMKYGKNAIRLVTEKIGFCTRVLFKIGFSILL